VVAEEVAEGATAYPRPFAGLRVLTGGGNGEPQLQQQESHELQLECQVVVPLWRGL
jgi:hypothetical protein